MNTLASRINRFAYDSGDSEEKRFLKSLLLVVAISCSVCGIAWSTMYYFILGPGLTMIIPLIFVVIVSAAIPISQITGNHKILAFAQVCCITWVTAALQWSIGSIHDSGMVIFWSLLGPMGALLFLDRKQSLVWLGIFLAIVAITVVVEPQWSDDAKELSNAGRIVFYLMNLSIPGSVIFAMVRYFVNSNRENIEKLKQTYAQLITSEKLAALGQVAAGVAHEVNTPLGAIKSSAEESTQAFSEVMDSLLWMITGLSAAEKELLAAFLSNITPSFEAFSTKEEREIKKQMREKFAALGIENNRFISDRFVQVGIHAVGPELEALAKVPDFEKIAVLIYNIFNQRRGNQTIQLAVDKASRVVKALKTYLHSSDGEEMKATNIRDNIETTLAIYQNRLKQGVQVIKNYEDVPEVLSHADQLNQVWTNLIVNAVQAMDNKGILTIGIQQLGDQVEVTFKDSGSGIPLEVQSKIFDPFFTTKGSGEGSGLGLHIIKRILEEHHATITFESVLGEGTTFFVRLPILKPV